MYLSIQRLTCSSGISQRLTILVAEVSLKDFLVLVAVVSLKDLLVSNCVKS